MCEGCEVCGGYGGRAGSEDVCVLAVELEPLLCHRD